MARIRTIKPEFWTHEDLSAQPEATHMLAAALLNYADDHGYFNAHPALIKAACFPLRELSTPVPESLKKLEKIGYLKFGTGSDGKRYGWIPTFDDHQVVNRAKPSKIKPLLNGNDPAGIDHGLINDGSSPEGNREQGTGKGREGNRDSPTDLESGDSDLLGDKPPEPKARALDRVVLDAYHRLLPSCRRISVLNPKRQKRIQAADKLARQVCKAQGWTYATAKFWEAYFERCKADPWLRGEVPNPRNPAWKQNLDVLLKEDRFAEIMDRAIAEIIEEEKSE